MKVNILAIESCTSVCSVSLIINNQRANRFVNSEKKSSSLLLNLCHEVLVELGGELGDIDYIVYTKGPGTFTGVRLCLAVVQGLAFSHNIPTLGFSTLAVLAYANKEKSTHLLPALDARMSEIYWAEVVEQTIRKQTLNKPGDLPRFNQKYWGIGSAWDIYGDALTCQTGIKHFVSNQHPHAKYLLQLALEYYQNNRLKPEQNIQALYLRNKVANIPQAARLKI